MEEYNCMDVSATLKSLKDILQGWFSGLSLVEVLTILLIILTLFLIYLAYKQNKLTHRQQRKKSSPLDIVSKDELTKRLQLEKEDYIARKHLEKIKLHEKPQYILIHGLSGVGKSREAVEIIQRLKRAGLEEVNIYFGKKSVTTIPIDPPQVYRNVILFLDDLRPSLEPSSGSYEGEGEKHPPFHKRLEKTVNLFEESVELNCVIITLLTEQYKILEEKFSGSNFLDKFSTIELEKFSLKEKVSYIKNFADLFKISIGESNIKSLANASDESLKKIRNFFKTKQDEDKTSIDVEDVEEFKKKIEDEWMGAYSKLSPQEKSIFDALTKLYQFSIPAFLYVVNEFYASSNDGFKPFRSLKFRKACKKLDGKWLEIEDNRVYCDDSRLFLKTVDDPLLIEDLQQLNLVIQQLSKKRRYKNDIYYLVTPLAHELHKYGMYVDAIKFYDHILSLPPRDLPISFEKVKSDFLFYKGHAYYSRGKTYWDKARDCYELSIKLNEKNLFAKHALATLYHKQYDSLKALDLLDEITEANKNDLLAYRTKLEIYIDTGMGLKRAKEAYRAIKVLLKSNNLPLGAALSAEFACIRFLVRIGEFFQEKRKLAEAEKQFQETTQRFKDLIDRIPSEKHEFKAIIRNAYGCFLYDILESDDGITQLEKAHEAWPEHEHTLHKLATIYFKKGEKILEERLSYWKKAKDYLDKLLKIQPTHYPALRSLAELEGKSIEWNKLVKSVKEGKLVESEFWKKVSEIYNKYKEALEPETDYPSLHNSVVHYTAGWTLWTVEMSARDFLQNKDPSIPSADVEFMKSCEIEKKFKDTKDIPWKIRTLLFKVYDTLGSYLITTGKNRNDHAIIDKGHSAIARAIELSKEKGRIMLHSQDTYTESYMGKNLLDSGELKDAKKRFIRAIELYENNLPAWWWLKEVHEREEDYQKAIECFGRYAEIKDSPSLYGNVRSTARRWMREGKIPQEINLLIKYSKKAYGLDPNGDQDLRNISDYAHDIYQKGKETADQDILEEKKVVLSALMEALNRFIECATLRDSDLSYALEKKQKAEKVCQELYPLLDDKEKKKLTNRASELGLKCS